ncbi:M14 family zinc carboxypeptidase [Eisenibacter elegans]|jgi:hypothetical protein|uniref:M14 family zinc carboxypeptidase n=1 Tax=Eisenibacter elegans TaxID=997 RepID=UPI000408723D|nr:M14 family zinc carboxypeptidase [Eisenibacter elegans]
MRYFYALSYSLALGLLVCMVGSVSGQAQTAAQTDLSYYLPQEGIQYDPAIPTPRQFFGFEIGEWHLSHDQLSYYMQALAAASPRITITEYARSFEMRPLLLLTITSPQNHSRLEDIRQEHLKLSNPAQSGGVNISQAPVVVWLGHSVHGNEPSGGNSAALVAYYLAAAQSAEIETMLQNTVILLDPCFNPDGFNRFASWVNSHRSHTLVTDPASREFNEAYPRGRTNHYWFDLNRDWLPVQMPESKGRIRQYQAWMPNILTDQHEMGTNATYFFQPGIPSRTNPLTPAKNQELTGKIAEFHGKALDKIRSLYYTKESFDDFYYGKGSTYPDVQGGIGILFEQASSRGHAQDSENGILHFPFTIRNQFTTALSTLAAAQAMREELLGFQRDFFKANKGGTGYVVGSEYDLARNYHFAEILHTQGIEFYELGSDYKQFKKGKAYVIPLSQPKEGLVRAMFQKETSFTDSLFYDISAWTFPLAFNLPYEQANAPRGDKVDSLRFPEGKLIGDATDAVVYAFRWDGYYAPRAAHELMLADARLKVVTEAFETVVEGKKEYFGLGTILLPVGIQHTPEGQWPERLAQLAKDNGLDIYALTKGLSDKGVDLGSRSFEALQLPKVLMIVGNGTYSYEAGEIWHVLDQRYHMPLSMIEAADIASADLSRYTTIVMPGGGYQTLGEQGVQKIKEFVSTGGTLITLTTANRWLAARQWVGLELKNTNFKVDSTKQYTYADRERLRGAQAIGGAIFAAKIDTTHPLAYGYHEALLPLFRANNVFIQRSKNPFANPLVYTEKPLMAGYISKQNLPLIANSAAVATFQLGRGNIIAMADNPNFRAFWYGTNRLFINALFFGNIVRQ